MIKRLITKIKEFWELTGVLAFSEVENPGSWRIADDSFKYANEPITVNSFESIPLVESESSLHRQLTRVPTPPPTPQTIQELSQQVDRQIRRIMDEVAILQNMVAQNERVLTQRIDQLHARIDETRTLPFQRYPGTEINIGATLDRINAAREVRELVESLPTLVRSMTDADRGRASLPETRPEETDHRNLEPL